MNREDVVYPGMSITRMVDGEPQRLDAIKPSVLKQIEMLGRMNDRWQAYRAAGDRESLLRLADEYEQAKMPRMAKYIRGDAEAI